jgi:hypothetical protein
MSGRRAVTLALLGMTWASVCLVVPPVVVDWLGPLVAPAPVGRASRLAPRATPRVVPAPDRTRPAPDPETPRRLDLYGNEIAKPVARYRVDRRGALYEVHSPETEVPRLAPPRL